MKKDGWKSFSSFTDNSEPTSLYYELVHKVFEAGVEAVYEGEPFTNAIDLGCGNGVLTHRLSKFAHNVFGVDSSPGLIDEAKANPDLEGITFWTDDVLHQSAFENLGDNGQDLITAAWLHNHFKSEAQHQALLDTIVRLSKPDARFVFLFPGIGFTTRKAQTFMAKLGWHQAWLGEDARKKHGVYQFGESPWQELWIWEPLWLARLYQSSFNVRFLDVKGLCIGSDGLGRDPIEPLFEVMIGTRKN